jgi:hypothetical protein
MPRECVCVSTDGLRSHAHAEVPHVPPAPDICMPYVWVLTQTRSTYPVGGVGLDGADLAEARVERLC